MGTAISLEKPYLLDEVQIMRAGQEDVCQFLGRVAGLQTGIGGALNRGHNTVLEWWQKAIYANIPLTLISGYFTHQKHPFISANPHRYASEIISANDLGVELWYVRHRYQTRLDKRSPPYSDYLQHEADLSPATIRNYLGDVTLFMAWYEQVWSAGQAVFSPEAIATPTLTRYRADLKQQRLKPATINRYLISLKRYFD